MDGGPIYLDRTAFEALKACLTSTPILGFPTEDGRFLLDTDSSLYMVGGVLNQIRKVIEKWSSPMPDEAFACCNRGNVQCAERYWWRLLCACIFGRIFVVLNSPFVRTTVPLGGYRNSEMGTGCWPVGTCCWASFQLLLNTVWEHNMPMQMVCRNSVDNVRGLTVRSPRRIYGL